MGPFSPNVRGVTSLGDSYHGNEENEEPVNVVAGDSDNNRFMKRIRVGRTPIKQKERIQQQKMRLSSRLSYSTEIPNNNNNNGDGQRQRTKPEFGEQEKSAESKIRTPNKLKERDPQQIFQQNYRPQSTSVLDLDSGVNLFHGTDQGDEVKNSRPSIQSGQHAESMRFRQERPKAAGGWTSSRKRSSVVDWPTSTATSTCSSSSNTSAATLVKRLVKDGDTGTSCPRVSTGKRVGMTPIRVKPKFKKEDVQATNTGYASVKKLSQWLADDPTSTRKITAIRRGANVIQKSRRFEKDLEDVIIEESNLRKGAVNEKRNLFQTGSRDEGEVEGEGEVFDEDTFRTHNRRNWGGGARSEIMINDTSSAISVTNKKKWLENAFKKADGEFVPKANTVVGPEDRDDITSRAKKMWQQRSNARNKKEKGDENRTPAVDDDKVREAHEHVVSFPSRSFATPDKTKKSRQNSYPVEEDRSKIDFSAARRILIDRSKKNGNEVRVFTDPRRRCSAGHTTATMDPDATDDSNAVLAATTESESGSVGVVEESLHEVEESLHEEGEESLHEC